jgi:hypothetical protein
LKGDENKNMEYEIIESDIDKGLYIIKMNNGLLISFYNIAYNDNNNKMYYKYDILNPDSDTNFESIDKKIKYIIKEIFFKEDYK